MVFVDVPVATADGAEDLAAGLADGPAAVDRHVIDEGAPVGVGGRTVRTTEDVVRALRAAADSWRAGHQHLGPEALPFYH